ncbi:hypothetical protein ACMXYW_05905 [Neptuniibacter sp. QD48_55]|uniref:hypothetical protein n=1 Tax=Neptuniibacter sp. QD48_55 TaxID=3398212 RepID=UPI0039F50337
MFEALFPNTELQSYSSHGAQELINRLSALESCKATINSAMEGVDGLVGVALKTTVLTNIASVLLNAGNSVGQQSCIAHIQKSRNVIVTEMNSSHI